MSQSGKETRIEFIKNRIPKEFRTVKSTRRTMEILEYFDDHRKAATVMEIANALEIPQSSMSALLRSLANLGYLNFDRYSKTYITSSRVALLGSWVSSDIFADGNILSLMKRLNQDTGDTIVLANRNGLYAQYIHVVQATSSARLHLSIGTVRSLSNSGAGFALLSTMPDDEVTRIVLRINAEASEDVPVVNFKDVLTRLETIREQGYVFTKNLVTEGGGILVAPLPATEGRSQMVVGIGGISSVMEEKHEALSEILLARIDEYVGSGADQTVGFELPGKD